MRASIAFPVAPVEGFDFERHGRYVATAHVDLYAIRVRARRLTSDQSTHRSPDSIAVVATIAIVAIVTAVPVVTIPALILLRPRLVVSCPVVMTRTRFIDLNEIAIVIDVDVIALPAFAGDEAIRQGRALGLYGVITQITELMFGFVERVHALNDRVCLRASESRCGAACACRLETG